MSRVKKNCLCFSSITVAISNDLMVAYDKIWHVVVHVGVKLVIWPKGWGKVGVFKLCFGLWFMFGMYIPLIIVTSFLLLHVGLYFVCALSTWKSQVIRWDFKYWDPMSLTSLHKWQILKWDNLKTMNKIASVPILYLKCTYKYVRNIPTLYTYAMNISNIYMYILVPKVVTDMSEMYRYAKIVQYL